MKTKNLSRTLALFAAMTLVSACGGGGGSVTLPLGPGPPDIPPVTSDVSRWGLVDGHHDDDHRPTREVGTVGACRRGRSSIFPSARRSDVLGNTAVLKGPRHVHAGWRRASRHATVGRICERHRHRQWDNLGAVRNRRDTGLHYRGRWQNGQQHRVDLPAHVRRQLVACHDRWQLRGCAGLVGRRAEHCEQRNPVLQDPASGCVINGQVSIINAAYNAYGIRFSYSSCTGLDSALNGVTFTGLAGYDAGAGQAIALVQGSVGGIPFAMRSSLSACDRRAV